MGYKPVATRTKVSRRKHVRRVDFGDLSLADDANQFKLKCQYFFVTYSRSSFHEKEMDEFVKLFAHKLPAGSKYYGCFELHKDGAPHYHAVVKLPSRVNWADGRTKLQLHDQDTKAIHFRTMHRGQRAKDFIENTVAYIDKELEGPLGTVKKPTNWLFGQKWEEDTAEQEKNRRFVLIDQIEDYDKCKEALRAEDAGRFIYAYNNVMSYLTSEKIRAAQPLPAPKYVVKPFCLPEEVLAWKRDNIDNPPDGRPRALVLIGEPRIGKTEWATSFGLPMVMSKNWNMSQYRYNATHIVVNDADVRKFGYNESYAREVLGCQEYFDATGKFQSTKRLDWGVPCIWSCNKEMDPMLDSDMAAYLVGSGATICYLGDKKLYIED